MQYKIVEIPWTNYEIYSSQGSTGNVYETKYEAESAIKRLKEEEKAKARYRIAVHYEQGFSFEVDADNEQKARKVAEELLDDFAYVEKIDGQDVKTRHREIMICDIEERFSIDG